MTTHGFILYIAKVLYGSPRGTLFLECCPLPSCSLRNGGQKDDVRLSIKIRVSLIHIVVRLFGFSNHSGKLGKCAGSRCRFLICGIQNSDREANSITA